MTNIPQKQKIWNAKSLIKSRENRSLETNSIRIINDFKDVCIKR